MLHNTAMRVVRYGDRDLLLWLHTSDKPDHARWEEAISRIIALKEQRNGDLSKLTSFIISDGGAPTSRQRAQIFQEVFGAKNQYSCVITLPLNPVRNGIVTAISWVNRSFRAFRSTQLDAALAHLKLEGAWPTLAPYFHEMQTEMWPVVVLAEIETFNRASHAAQQDA